MSSGVKKYTFHCVYEVEALNQDDAWREFITGNYTIFEETIIDEREVKQEPYYLARFGF